MIELYEHPLFTGFIPYYNKVMDTLETNLLYNKVMDGKSLVHEVMRDHGTIFNDVGKQYWLDTLDESKSIKYESMNTVDHSNIQ